MAKRCVRRAQAVGFPRYTDRFCTQFKQSDWHHHLSGGVHADAIMDRMVHGAAWFNSGEVNMREKLAKTKTSAESV